MSNGLGSSAVSWLEAVRMSLAVLAFLSTLVALESPAMARALCSDNDGDGYAICDGTCDDTGLLCGDCDDSNAAVHPGVTETCNGIDDDCNGVTDDGLGDTTCGLGACRRTVANCAAGVAQECVIGPPSAETCNGIDDDCDGSIDGGLVQACDNGCEAGIQVCGSACTATPCCDCAVGAGAPYPDICSASAAGCEVICVPEGVYDPPACNVRVLVAMSGPDVTTIDGNVGTAAGMYGFTVTGDVTYAHPGNFVRNRVQGDLRVNLPYAEGGIHLLCFNHVDGALIGAESPLIWGNAVGAGGIQKWGTAPAVVSWNHVHDAPIGIYVRHGSQVDDNIIERCDTGIVADGGQDLLVFAATGNVISGGAIGISVGQALDPHRMEVVGNSIRGTSSTGISVSTFAEAPGTVIGNLIDLEASRGGSPAATGISIRGSGIVAENTIVDGGTGVSGYGCCGGTVASLRLDSNVIALHHDAGVALSGPIVATADHNDVFGNGVNWSGLPDPTGADGNISHDPMFVDPSSHNWRLTPGSPCIDTGLSSNLPWDLDGRPRVSDGDGDGIATEDMGAFELPADADPECAAAVAVVGNIWPPNHQVTPIPIAGVSDPEGDPVTIEAIGVTQDEPVSDYGTGNTSPDARIVNGQAQVRAERLGEGNGRVYRISFRADDGRGGHCEGAVAVCVAHDWHTGHACVDDGQNYNSLEGAERATPRATPGVVVRPRISSGRDPDGSPAVNRRVPRL